MATVSKQFTGEDVYTGNYKSYWTYTMSSGNVTVNSATFTLPSVTCTAKISESGLTAACASLVTELHVGAWFDYFSFKIPNGSAFPSNISWANGSTKTLYNVVETNYVRDKRGYGTSVQCIALPSTMNTGDVFTSSNKYLKTVDIKFDSTAIFSQVYGTTDTNISDPYGGGTVWTVVEDSIQDVIIGTVTLNVPPTMQIGTPTYATPHYAGFGIYSVPITTASAYYGGDISKATLTVGADSITKTYSSTTINNKTISIIPTNAGTFTPTLTIEDSRGQTKTETLPQITINPYNIPSVSFDVYRTNDNGIKTDEGDYGLIKATISFEEAVANLTAPTVSITDMNETIVVPSSIIWYATAPPYDENSIPITDWTTIIYSGTTPPTIYGLIDGSFLGTESYQITIIETDSNNKSSTSITQTLSTAFYTIDFQAGGKEIAFGAPANDVLTNHSDGLFKCNMDVQFDNTAEFNGLAQFDNTAEFNGLAQFNSSVIVSNLIGEIKAYAGITIPDGWLLCDGHEELIEDYPLLAASLGADHPDPNDPDYINPKWGAPSVYTKFKLPDLSGRVPVGYLENDTNFGNLGQTGGQSSVTLTAGQSGLPSHSHPTNGNTYFLYSNANIAVNGTGRNWPSSGGDHHFVYSDSGSANITEATTTGLRQADASTAHTNLQPYAVVQYIICAA